MIPTAPSSTVSASRPGGRNSGQDGNSETMAPAKHRVSGHGDKLKRKQEVAIAHVLTDPTVKAAAARG